MTTSAKPASSPPQSADAASAARPDAPAVALKKLRDSRRTLQLATLDQDGEPHIGYTPHLLVDGDILIFVSQLAAHTRNLLANGKAAVLLIDDEVESAQIFARTRVSYRCHATPISTDDASYEHLLDDFEARHGKMIGLLRQLPDFVLFRMRPQSGQFVMGFGKAYTLSGERLDTFEHATRG